MRKAKWVIVPILLLMIASCATWRDNTYKTIGTLGITYDTAMRGAADLKKQGKITDAQWAELDKIARIYYVAYQGAVDAFEIAVKVESTESKDRLNKALLELSVSLDKVLAYISILKGGAK